MTPTRSSSDEEDGEVLGGITIRSCRFQEASMVLDLWRDADAIPSHTDTLEELERVLRRQPDLFVVAEVGGRLVGTLIAGWDGWRGHIYRLAVLPGWRRGGVGRALVREAERRLRAKGARRLSILVVGHDECATAFWDGLEADGYELDSRIVRYVKTLP